MQIGAFVNDFNQGGSRDKRRAIDYFLVKTLLDFLPIKGRDNRRGKFTQAEREFGLSVLSLCGRLPDIDRWYIDMPWDGNRGNLEMVAGADDLLTYLDTEGKLLLPEEIDAWCC